MSNKILIIDDEEMNVVLIQDILEEENYTIQTAFSGEEALSKIAEFNPDVVLLDIMMRGIDGYETCKRIRQIPGACRFTKVIMISGKTLLHERLEGYEAGADDYVTKPIVADELIAKIRVFTRLKKAEEIDQIKSDLLTLFSHETKTPLNAIFGFSELLKESENLNETDKKYLDRIMESGRQLLVFIDKTSVLCELKKGIKLDLSPHPVLEHIASVMARFEQESLKKKVPILIDIQDNFVLCADWILLCKAFEYLLDNALKFSKANESIIIKVRREDNNCIISFIDKGEGIPPDWISFIFDPFSVRNIQHHHKGQGLSLSICKHIMEHHKGDIYVESELGKGATFTLKIPIIEYSETDCI